MREGQKHTQQEPSETERENIKKIGNALVHFIDYNDGYVYSIFGDKNVRRRDTKLYDIEFMSSDILEREIACNPNAFRVADWKESEATNARRINVCINIGESSLDYYGEDTGTKSTELIYRKRFSNVDSLADFVDTAKISDMEFEFEFINATMNEPNATLT